MRAIFWDFAASWPVVAAGGAALAASLWLGFLHARRNAGSRGFLAAETVRIAGVLALIFTLLQPELVRLREKIRDPVLAILWDASDSMNTRDVVAADRPDGEARRKTGPGAMTRAEWVRSRVEAGFWEPLERRYKTVVSDFSAVPTGTTATARAPEDAGTDINLALETAMKTHSELRAVLLMTDGDWNTGLSPVSAATKLRMQDIPVFGVAVGSESFLPDIELQSVRAPAYGLMDEHISIPFTIRSSLPREVRTTVSLRGPGVDIRKPVVIPPMAQMQETLVLVPGQEGEFDFTVEVPPEKDEVPRDNNAKSFRMSLRREVLKVLLIESVPRWEYRFLHNALSRDPGVLVRCLLLHPGMEPGSGRDYIAAFPRTKEELSQYDVVFLGDVGLEPERFTAEDAEMLKGLVEQQGSGLVFLPGRLGRQAELESTALWDLMPVELDKSAGAGFGFGVQSQLALTSRGREHLITTLASDETENLEVWRRLPGFFWHASALRVKTGAEVLAVHSTARNRYGRIPLLVTRSCGNGKTLFMGIDSAWRWRRGMEDKYHYRFWAQVARWMAHQRHLAHTEGIRFFFAPESPRRGEKVFLHATVFDKAGYPLREGTVDARISVGQDYSEQTRLVPEPGGWGVFTGSFVPERDGVHTIAAECREADRGIETQLTVVSPKREVIGRPARASVLREIAAITKGKCVAVEDFAQALEGLARLPKARPVEERVRVWCHPLWAAFLLGLLSLYWTARKLIGKV